MKQILEVDFNTQDIRNRFIKTGYPIYCYPHRVCHFEKRKK